MTQPTIKEKINEFRDKFFSKNPFEQEMYDKEFPKFFARLICEEMINKENNLWEPGDSLEEKFGWDQCVEEQKAKAQEILKALE